MDVKEIINAIKEENTQEIISFFNKHPEQKRAYTFFAGKTWLGYAVGQGKISVVKTMVMAGLDVNQGCKRDNVKPICDAAHGHTDIVQYLLSCGAELDVSAPLTNPLFWAVRHWEQADDTETVVLLLKSGIDSTIKYEHKSRTKNKADLDAAATAFLWGTPAKAGIIAAWNAKGNKEQIEKLIKEAEIAAHSHVANYKFGEEKLKKLSSKGLYPWKKQWNLHSMLYFKVITALHTPTHNKSLTGPAKAALFLAC